MVSLLVSFTLTPMMCARFLKVKARRADGDIVGLAVDGTFQTHAAHDSKHSAVFGPIDRAYTSLLEWAMNHRGLVAAVAVLVLFSSVPLFRMVNINFTPQDDTSELEVTLRAPEGTSLEATDVLANRVATGIRAIPEVAYTMTTVAGDGASTRNGASVFVKLKALDARDRDVFAVVEEVRTTVLPKSAPSGVRTSVAATGGIGGGRGGGGAGDIQFVMRGPDLRRLQADDSRPCGRGHEPQHR
jgi:HAE1 family hydrophobic/amphiphilic exporter-1